jgi:small subunit ribosomal protein S24
LLISRTGILGTRVSITNLPSLSYAVIAQFGLANVIVHSYVISATILDGKRAGLIAAEDLFIRKFMLGTWHNLCLSEIIIKRQFNMIRIGGLIYQGIHPRKMYFLIGYTEELLSQWLQCPVKLELQTVADKKAIVYKYV